MMIRPLYFLLVGVLVAGPAHSRPEPLESWQSVIRESPYWLSQGVFDNLVTIRSWVLQGDAFCEKKDRHILFDRRARFIGYISDAADEAATQRRLNDKRAALAAAGRVDEWVPGRLGRVGYPFALSCNQPAADLSAALARYTGIETSARLWGTWDGMRIGDKDDTVSLHAAILGVYEDRRQRGRVSLPPQVLSSLAGKVLIESGGRPKAHSAADARGIMQLSPAALSDCELSERFYFHRMAQIDCALQLLEQNHRNLEPVFQSLFGDLPAEKAEKLYSMLLLQAYHGGVGRVSELMTAPDLNGPARYFAYHHENFSAGDIALGMVFHNLGRDRLGFSSLYYVADVGIATKAACSFVEGLPGC